MGWCLPHMRRHGSNSLVNGYGPRSTPTALKRPPVLSPARTRCAPRSGEKSSNCSPASTFGRALPAVAVLSSVGLSSVSSSNPEDPQERHDHPNKSEESSPAVDPSGHAELHSNHARIWRLPTSASGRRSGPLVSHLRQRPHAGSHPTDHLALPLSSQVRTGNFSIATCSVVTPAAQRLRPIRRLRNRAVKRPCPPTPPWRGALPQSPYSLCLARDRAWTRPARG